MKNISQLTSVPASDELQKEKSWISKEVARISFKKLEELAKTAAKARERTYSPYSGYAVGVALLTASGEIVEGVNAERVSYSETDHAEESAVTGAIVKGEIQKSGRKFIRAIAVSTSSGGTPCGRCRQIIIEHCDNCLVVTANQEGKIQKITSIRVLLPYAFTPSDLGK